MLNAMMAGHIWIWLFLRLYLHVLRTQISTIHLDSRWSKLHFQIVDAVD